MPEVVVTAHSGIDIETVRSELEPAVSVRAAEIDTPADIEAAAAGAEGVILLKTPIPRDVIESLEDLEVIGQCSVGVDHVDLEAAREREVTVLHVPSYCPDEVSTHAFALLLSCARKLPQYDASVKAGEWDWSVGRPIHRLNGHTLGVVAFGDIARRTAAKAASFGLDVVAYDPYVDAEEMESHGASKVDFEELLDRSDHVVSHAPLTDETEGLFDADAFARLDERAVFVNVGRGPVVDQTALYEALRDGEIAAAGLDVLVEEPPGDSPLFDLENVVVTPHAAFYSEEALEERNRKIAADVRRVLAGEPPENPVSRPDWMTEAGE